MAVKALPARLAGIERKYIEAVKPEEREAAQAHDPQGDIVYRLEPLSNLALTRLMSRYADLAGDGESAKANIETASELGIDLLRYSLKEIGGLVNDDDSPFVLEFDKDKTGEFVTARSINRLPQWLFAHLLGQAQGAASISESEEKALDFSQSSSPPISDNAPATSEAAPIIVATEVSG